MEILAFMRIPAKLNAYSEGMRGIPGTRSHSRTLIAQKSAYAVFLAIVVGLAHPVRHVLSRAWHSATLRPAASAGRGSWTPRKYLRR